MVYGIIALLALLVDQFLKFWTVSNVALNTGIRPLIPGFLHITYIKNFGAAFGVMSSFGALRWILLILLIAFTALMVFAFIKGYFRTGLTKVSGALLLAGLLGNGIDLGYIPNAQLALVGGKPSPTGNGRIVVACAGTSDLPVAEEAALTAEFYGNEVDRLYDVGVAGLHRLLAHAEELAQAQVVIAIAGMEGALASVIGGLVSCPVIAVPTSVGYGASFGGVAALLAMLNSCASGVSVVNIDNGFGAAYQASLINHLSAGTPRAR